MMKLGSGILGLCLLLAVGCASKGRPAPPPAASQAGGKLRVGVGYRAPSRIYVVDRGNPELDAATADQVATQIASFQIGKHLVQQFALAFARDADPAIFSWGAPLMDARFNQIVEGSGPQRSIEREDWGLAGLVQGEGRELALALTVIKFGLEPAAPDAGLERLAPVVDLRLVAYRTADGAPVAELERLERFERGQEAEHARGVDFFRMQGGPSLVASYQVLLERAARVLVAELNRSGLEKALAITPPHPPPPPPCPRPPPSPPRPRPSIPGRRAPWAPRAPAARAG